MAAFEITLAANTPYPLPGGNMFMLRETVYPVTVRFNGPLQQELTNDSAVDVEAGFKIKPSRTSLVDAHGNRPRAFNSCTVESATAQTIKLYIADGEVDDDRTSGTVQVQDGGKARTVAQKSFIGPCEIGPAASNYSHVQLLNPAGSGVNAFVKSVRWVCATSNAVVYGYKYNTALSTLAFDAKMKDLDQGVDTVLEMRTEHDTAGKTVAGADHLFTHRPDANEEVHVFDDPLRLQPGKGVILYNANVNQSLAAVWDYYTE